MEHITFSYSYSAKENSEIKAIREKYLPQKVSRMDELRRLDRRVQSAGMIEGLSIGIGGVLIFGLGICFGLGAIAESMVAAVALCIIGIAAMLPAYPVYRRISDKVKRELTPEILKLAEELSN